MKILLVGASGTLGQAVRQALSRHQILAAGRNSGDLHVDITDSASVRRMFEQAGRLDAIVSATGSLHFGPLAEMSAADFRIGLNDKLLGQIDLALTGQHYLNDGGSITLTSGIISAQPIRHGANATAVNRALEGFAAAAALELGRDRRINVVSPNALQESWGGYAPYFPGFEPVPAARAALAYVRSVEGIANGQTLTVW
ncbi:short chain dehydrogenase [Chromobacterium phragmitis]|uniref:Short chain dehydrogenase n=1 Tax=Chromobacterium phragmitis TaxID=2202141 RepID=A0A344ULH8_9NEIS|nr:short chain dehydrogenase [Chromobacterium phragmitis]AXE30749.1 short chain dehydrogenase [Chromobacterium phragmitis]AXE36126.1 short chain dehydrogenase [Chromobacterium phragmitis]